LHYFSLGQVPGDRVTISKDRNYLAFFDRPDTTNIYNSQFGNKIRIINLKNGIEMASIETSVTGVKFSEDEKYLVYNDGNDKIQAFDLENGEINTLYSGGESIGGFWLTPNYRLILQSRYKNEIGHESYNLVVVNLNNKNKTSISVGLPWDYIKKEDTEVIVDEQSNVLGLRIENKAWLMLYDLVTGKQISKIENIINASSQAVLKGAEFLPDNKTVVTSWGDSTIRLWDIVSGKNDKTFKDKYKNNGFFMSQDKRYLVTRQDVRYLMVDKGLWDKEKKDMPYHEIWDIKTGKLLKELYDINFREVFEISINNKYLISSDSVYATIRGDNRTADTIYIWNISNLIPPFNNPIVRFNGTILEMDVSPVIQNGRLLIPFRPIAEAMGAEVSWDQTTQTVGISLMGTNVRLSIGSSEAYVNDQKKQLDVPAKIINGRTMVPLRFISESLGAEVSWDALNKIASISFPLIIDSKP
jgi:WD40 repeat protein